MSTPETPRTWTLQRRFGEPWRVAGSDNDRGPIDVVEKAPVDAERERLLDLLWRAGEEIGTDAEGDPWPVAREIWACLREYGRLGTVES